MGNVFKKNKMTEAIEPLAVDLGVDGYVNAVAEKGFTDATKDAVSSGIDNVKQDVKGKVEKAEEVAGFIQDDFNSLKENVSDFFASDEEKQKSRGRGGGRIPQHARPVLYSAYSMYCMQLRIYE